MESILVTIKKMLGIHEDDTAFDTDIIVAINMALMVLNQLGVGPERCFVVTTKDNKWTEFLEDLKEFEAIKTYIYLKVRLVFDPPSTSFVIASMERQITELEWRFSVKAEGGTKNV